MISYQNIKWLGKDNNISETMLGKNCQTFRISQFSLVDMHSNILELWEIGEEFWNGVFCILSPGALPRWYINLALLKYTLIKKKCNFPTILKGKFSLYYMYSNFRVSLENREQFWNGVFAYCHQEHRQNEILYKIHLSTLFRKRNTTFHSAFLLRLSVWITEFWQNIQLHVWWPVSIRCRYDAD